jgi:catechol 2,3-dioxygenase-like lactoylglutathione lyase family enzyme
MLPRMINGAHVIIYTKNAEKTRAFFRDILKFPNVDAGHGWLIFKLPPAELGIHPAEKASDEAHELYLMCDDVKKTVAELKKKKIKCGPVQETGFGIMTSIQIPGGGKLGLYQPRHPTATALKARK